MNAASAEPLITVTPHGLYCAAGDFHIDPWRPVERAVLTHAHADHARSGSERYLAATPGLGILRERLGAQAAIDTLAYGERLRIGNAAVSLHPAGHVLGSAQLRVEVRGCVWVVSGDYKRDPDPTCAPFEPLACHTFITEATFALPVYRWPAPAQLAREIFDWWQQCAADGRCAVLCCYALGKAQRVLAELMRHTDETVFLHGAIARLVERYREAGIAMLPTRSVAAQDKRFDWAGRLVLAPPGASGSPWLRRFRPVSLGFASGWMRIRGTRRRSAYDRGFQLSDHADWPSLLRTVEETGTGQVLATHGNTDALIAYLRSRGLEAAHLATEYEGEPRADECPEDTQPSAAAD